MIDVNELRHRAELGYKVASDIVIELLDRLEAAESECLEEARLNGMGSEREAALMAKLEAAEKEIALKERLIDALGSELNAVANERDALRAEVIHIKEVEFPRKAQAVADSWRGKCERLEAKIAEMEQQEQVAEWVDSTFDQYPYLRWREPYKAIAGAKLYTKFYALPCAQPESSVNEGVRKVTLGFRWESEAQHHIPTIEIEFDPVSPDSPNDAKGWQDRDRLAAMLTPEAKP